MNEVVERWVDSRRAHGRGGLEVVRRIEKQRLPNSLKMLGVPQARRSLLRAWFPKEARSWSGWVAAPVGGACNDGLGSGGFCTGFGSDPGRTCFCPTAC